MYSAKRPCPELGAAGSWLAGVRGPLTAARGGEKISDATLGTA
jgi:hypothetical protein